MIHDPDDVESVGHYSGLWEVLLHQGAIACGQIDTDDFYLMFSFEPLQPAFQGSANRITCRSRNAWIRRST